MRISDNDPGNMTLYLSGLGRLRHADIIADFGAILAGADNFLELHNIVKKSWLR